MTCAADRKAAAPVPAVSHAGLPAHPAASAEARGRFDQLVLPHLRDAYELALWLTGSCADTEDVVQEACMRAFRGIDRFRGGSARPWLLTIVRHTAYDWLHKNRPAALVPGEELETIADPVTTRPDSSAPEAAAIAGQHVSLLRAAMAALPLACRETLVLREIHELTYREIAAITCVPIGTVMSRLARARATVATGMRTA